MAKYIFQIIFDNNIAKTYLNNLVFYLNKSGILKCSQLFWYIAINKALL